MTVSCSITSQRQNITGDIAAAEAAILDAQLHHAMLVAMDKYGDAQSIWAFSGSTWVSARAFHDATHVDPEALARGLHSPEETRSMLVLYVPVATPYGEARLYGSRPVDLVKGCEAYRNGHGPLVECLRATVIDAELSQAIHSVNHPI
jgi:hypothetical protein